MPSIVSGQKAALKLQMQADGAPITISQTSTVTARIYDASGLNPLSGVIDVAVGAEWGAGVVNLELDSTQTAVPVGEAVLTISSTEPAVIKRFRLVVQSLEGFERSLLFIKDIAVDRLRSDALMMAASGVYTAVSVSDDYLWDKLRAAESEIAHELRVPLVPTHFFYDDPTPEQVAALGGQAWGIDPGYDYAPSDFAYNDKWGFIKMRNKPLQSVSEVRFSYPGGPTANYKLPLDWLRPDKKYGHIQFVPSSTAFAAPLNTFVMQAIGQGRTIPLAIQFEYVAGLADVHKNYPELIDAIMKKAIIKIIGDAFLPSSGSISADGLSQSVSTDMEKYGDAIDRIINGGKGENGGLMAAIHGIRYGVIGG